MGQFFVVAATLLLSLRASASAADAGALALSTRGIALPGSPSPVSMDYLAYDASRDRVWVPAGNTGAVDVIDAATSAVHQVTGFPTAKKVVRGSERTVGPSSATVGDGVVYIGNRADKTVCAVDAAKLTRGGCAVLSSAPDGIAYAATTKEVWVTLPAEKRVVVLDAAEPGSLKLRTSVEVGGQPEGYAIDPAGWFFTNLEDKDETLKIDLRTHKISATWSAGCGEEGPAGLAFDGADGLLLIACRSQVVALDAKSGASRGKVATGPGNDNVDFSPASRKLYVASGKDGTVRLIQVGASGSLAVAVTDTAVPGGRTIVIDRLGRGYVPLSAEGEILVVEPSQASPAK